VGLPASLAGRDALYAILAQKSQALRSACLATPTMCVPRITRAPRLSCGAHGCALHCLAPRLHIWQHWP